MSGLDNLKIMIVSANAHEYNPGGGDCAHDAFVMKPVDIHLLIERVGTLLGLQWLYEPTTAPATEEPRPVSSVTMLPSRSRHHLDDLYRLGSIGHVRGIEAKLRELEAEDAAHRALAAELRKLVTKFDLKGYMNVLEAMRKNA
jgi:hypothetical protein